MKHTSASSLLSVLAFSAVVARKPAISVALTAMSVPFLLGPKDALADPTKMCWTDEGAAKIQCANPDGTSIQDVVTGLASPFGIDLDVAGGKMYWTEQTGEIRRANLDGTGFEDLVTGLPDPLGISLDVASDKMYWADFGRRVGPSLIKRANLDGTAVEDLVTSGLASPDGIALDVTGGKMYWTDFGTDSIRRANLDGTAVEILVTGAFNVGGMDLDVAGGKMYWLERILGKIQRANIDGTGVEDLVTGLIGPRRIALMFEIRPEEAIQEIIEDVIALNLSRGISNSLDAKLDTALQALDDVNSSNDVAAINILEAFINAVEAQSGNQIDVEDADQLVSAARSIIDSLLSGG